MMDCYGTTNWSSGSGRSMGALGLAANLSEERKIHANRSLRAQHWGCLQPTSDGLQPKSNGLQTWGCVKVLN